MDFTSRARQAVYSTLSPEAVLSPSALHTPGGRTHPPTPLLPNPLSPSALDRSAASLQYSELVAAARAAASSIPLQPLPRVGAASIGGSATSPLRAAAILGELDAAMQRLQSLRGAAASLESRASPSSTGRFSASQLQSPPSSSSSSSSSPHSRSNGCAASELSRSGASPAAALVHLSRLSERVSSLEELQSSLSASSERLRAATVDLGGSASRGSAAAAAAVTAAAAAAAAAAPLGSPPPIVRSPSASPTPQWLPRTPLPSFRTASSSSSSAAPSPYGSRAAAAASALASAVSPAHSPSRKRPSPSAAASNPSPFPAPLSQLTDAHSAQRSAEALYHAASAWRASLGEGTLERPVEGPTLVTHALTSAGIPAPSPSPPSAPAPSGEVLLTTLCHAVGLEWHQQDLLLERVQDLSRVAVACSGLNEFAGRVCEQLGTRLVGLGEVWEGDTVSYRPLEALSARGAVAEGLSAGAAFVGLSQAEALLDAALTELHAHRAVHRHKRQ